MGIIFQPESMDFFEPVETPLILLDGSHPKGYLVPSDYLRDNIVHDHPLWRTLVERIAVKKQQRILIPELEYEDITSQMLTDIRLAYLGSTSGNTVYIRNTGRPDCKYLPPSSGGVTNNELAREYLRLCLEEGAKKGQVLRCPKRHEKYLEIPPALYYEPGPLDGRHHDDFAYVDIREAYWTLHRTATIDMRYEPDGHVMMGKVPYLDTAEVTSFRQLRHAIPGNLRCGQMQIARHGQFSLCDFKGRLNYPGIIGYVMHVMHAIAREVIDNFSAAMVLTDAYIVPQDRAELLREFLWERWAVNSVIKSQGPGSLYGLNVYQVEAYRSGHAPVKFTTEREWTYRSEEGRERVLQPDASPISTLADLDTSWLLKQRKIILQQGLGCDTTGTMASVVP